MQGPIPRDLEKEAAKRLDQFPAVALLGPRQCGKTTLAKQILAVRGGTYLDLERPADALKLSDPELFLSAHVDRLVCLDEVHRAPGLFPTLRGLIDRDRRPGRFLLLGSASPDLLRQGAETLAGRLGILELTPFLLGEVAPTKIDVETLWRRGGFPDSLLAADEDASLRWRTAFARTFLERDILSLGFRVPATTMERFWRMLAHHHGQLLNQSALGRSLGVNHVTVRHYLDMLEQTFMVRVLPPYAANLGKRLVKSPKPYLRDSGLLHALLKIETRDDLLGHPVRGASFEGFVIEQILGAARGWRGSFYRTATGAELDLVLERGRRRVAVECKLSSAPAPTAGFWNALADLDVQEAFVVAPVEEAYPLRKGVTVAPLAAVLDRVREA
jgi:hypothetical protein